MYVRISIVIGASDIDGGVAVLRDHVAPRMKQQKGFRALNASGDRAGGVVEVLSVWDTQADLEASESTAEKARADAMRVMGGEVSVQRYEQGVYEVGDTPPGPGAKVHIRHVKMDPSRIDGNLDFFQQNVVPDMKTTPGFLGVRHLVDRNTGEGRVSSLWVDEDSCAAALARSEQRRAMAKERGVEFGQSQVLEVLFAV